ncbi:MAG TPA: hypothetical protein VFV07_05830 [Rhizomicrobium sp.]|nr:hypothetical protein [Rhizomicrobium sp.]
MSSLKRALGAAAAASALLCLTAGVALAAPPVEAFGSLPQEWYGRISPDARIKLLKEVDRFLAANLGK